LLHARVILYANDRLPYYAFTMSPNVTNVTIHVILLQTYVAFRSFTLLSLYIVVKSHGRHYVYHIYHAVSYIIATYYYYMSTLIHLLLTVIS